MQKQPFPVRGGGEGGVKSLRTMEGGQNILGLRGPIWGGGCTFAGGGVSGQYPITCHVNICEGCECLDLVLTPTLTIMIAML